MCDPASPTFAVDVGASFAASLDGLYELGEVVRWGIAFTTYEDDMERDYGCDALPAIKMAIDVAARQRIEALRRETGLS